MSRIAVDCRVFPKSVDRLQEKLLENVPARCLDSPCFQGIFMVQMVAGPVDEGRSNLHRAGLCKGKQWIIDSLRFFSRLG